MSGHLKRSKYAVVSTLAVAGLLISSCGGEVKPDESARAKIDQSNSTIVMPLDDYDISNMGYATISLAREVAIGKCMAKHAFVTTRSPQLSVAEDRDYGLWNVERAGRYGYGMIQENRDTQSTDTKGEAWETARSQCLSDTSSEVAGFTPPDPLMTRSATNEVRAEAQHNAQKDPKWSEYREDWWQCLKDVGLLPRTGDSDWASQQAIDILTRIDPKNPSPADKEEEIRTALKEAKCNQSTQLTQRLGDLEAGYQATLIKAKQAPLNEEKTKNQAYVENAKKYLATNQ
ncbi:hypothetical protein J7E83_17870 [Arthrobacter sp. ISL-48]|uniref:hypothetical protein n=1 Tax=Arthrobacter sp. ISL-48 TaxID=2819110 RepID=UPI001BEB8351|nr:hypothetical protein [Arthrobacter sp. ISL-48]MBT2533957.1 hypothetical protein [Arthrobacter sp. ISL-48]